LDRWEKRVESRVIGMKIVEKLQGREARGILAEDF
jgi:hypothetical protein